MLEDRSELLQKLTAFRVDVISASAELVIPKLEQRPVEMTVIGELTDYRRFQNCWPFRVL